MTFEESLVLDMQGWAPEFVRLLPMGQVRLTDDREPFTVDQDGLAKVLRAYRQSGNDLPIDYEHQSLKGGKAPAAGWIKDLEIKADGLWAKVEWTPAAIEHLQKREYRYFSPVVKLDDQRVAVRLYHAALTNTPAIANLTPLVMKAAADPDNDNDPGANEDAAHEAQEARATKYGIAIKKGGAITKPAQWKDVPDEQFGDPVNYRYPMPDLHQAEAAWRYWNKADNQAQYDEGERAKIGKRINSRAKSLGMDKKEAAKMLGKLQELFVLKEAGEDQLLALAGKHLQAFQAITDLTEALGLPADAGTSQIKGAILALKQGGDRLATVETELTALKAGMRDKEVAEVVGEALQAGKVTPAQKDWAESYARQDLDGFKVFVAKAPVVVQPGQKFSQEAPKGAEGLTPEELEMCKTLGVTVEAYKAEKEKIAGHQEGN